jgi:TM2 domain-containing membrane protein YozV
VTSGSLSHYDPIEPPEPRGARTTVSERSRGVALGLAIAGGWFGLHRFYVGRTQSGIWMCLTFGGLGIWYLYDVVIIATGDFRDGDGQLVAQWGGSDVGIPPIASDRRVSDLEDRMQGLESQVGELAERLDFAERLLAQARERGSLPKA